MQDLSNAAFGEDKEFIWNYNCILWKVKNILRERWKNVDVIWFYSKGENCLCLNMKSNVFFFNSHWHCRLFLAVWPLGSNLFSCFIFYVFLLPKIGCNPEFLEEMSFFPWECYDDMSIKCFITIIPDSKKNKQCQY